MRNNHSTLILSLITVGLAFFVFKCSSPTMTAGTVTQSGNGRVAGVLVTTTGAPASGTQVKLFPSDFNPVINGAIVPVETTDTNGHYAFDGIKTGSYNVVAIQPDQKVQAATFGINVVSGDTFIVPPDTMRITGSIKIVLPTTVDTVNGYFFIPGTTIFSLINDHIGTAILDSVPAGVNLSIYYAVKGNSTQPQLVRDSVEVTSGGIMNIEYIGWIFSKKLILNTTASGAGVVGNVTDFPVLVRLTSANFKFTEAKQDGADLRFTKADGSPLPFEIETWDGANSAAAVWVKIDTVFGNDSTHFINMFWGNSNATSASNSAAVFGTAQGFQGVWHLADNAASSLVKDATGKNDGAMKAGANEIQTFTASVTGTAGRAMHFPGGANKSWIDLGANRAYINNASEITISLWLNAETDTFASKEVFCFSKGGSLTANNPESRISLAIAYNQFILKTHLRDSDAGTIITTLSTFVPKQWYYCVGVLRVPQDSLYFYVDGTLWDAQKVSFNTSATDVSNSTSSSIGANDLGLDDWFVGNVDEARLEVFARSADWIKLSYENQKANDAVIVFR